MKMKLINQKRLKMKMKIENQFQNENENSKSKLKIKFLFQVKTLSRFNSQKSEAFLSFCNYIISLWNEKCQEKLFFQEKRIEIENQK